MSQAQFQTLRKALGLRQQDMAGLLRVNRTTISRWEVSPGFPSHRAISLPWAHLIRQLAVGYAREVGVPEDRLQPCFAYLPQGVTVEYVLEEDA